MCWTKGSNSNTLSSVRRGEGRGEGRAGDGRNFFKASQPAQKLLTLPSPLITGERVKAVLCIALALALLAGHAVAQPPATEPAAKKLFDEGRALAAAHDHQAAIAKYAESLADDPNQAVVHAYKAASHLALGQVDLAQQEADAALKLDAKDFRFHEIAGQVKLVQNKIPEGKALYAQAAKLSPPNAGAIYTDLAAALAERNDPALTNDIDAALKTAAAADPPGADALFQLGQSYANAGKQEGRTYLQRYLDVSSKLPESERDAQKMQVARQLIRALDVLRQGQ